MRKNRGIQAAAYTAATLVMLCVAGMSWSGLYGWARQVLGWPEITAAAVPVSLDVAALTCALFALDTVSRNDPATAYRALTGIFVGLSAFINWRFRISSHNVTEEVFFPAMSTLAFLLIDTTVRKYRRDSRREQHGERGRQAQKSLTRYGILAWIPGIGHPVKAWGATSAELAERIPAQNQNRELAIAGPGTGNREPGPTCANWNWELGTGTGSVGNREPGTGVGPAGNREPKSAVDGNRELGNGLGGPRGTGTPELEPEPASPGTGNREPRRSPEETAAALVPAAEAFIARYRTEHGRDPLTDELREHLRVKKTMACAVYRLYRWRAQAASGDRAESTA